jgi:hypothetical protein
MDVRNLRNSLRRLEETVKRGSIPTKKGVSRTALKNRILTNIKSIEENTWKVSQNINDSNARLQLLVHLDALKKSRDSRSLVLIGSRMQNLITSLNDKEKFNFDFSKVHSDIKEEILADLEEIQKCFKAKCYRSAVILCGRLLEISLHRKYYDITQKDILETNPGIGLGKLIAKLVEKKVDFEPGITQQIHLINNVRISSVHKKKKPFKPSKAQTHATILFTLDIIEKLF